MQLTEHLDRFKTGKMGTTSVRIGNAPGQPEIEYIAPEYEAGLGDLLLLHQELLRMRHGRRPWEKWEQRAFRSLGFVFSIVGLGVFLASEAEVSRTLLIVSSAWLGLGLVLPFIFVVLSIQPRTDTFALDYEIKTITELLNTNKFRWHDINGR